VVRKLNYTISLRIILYKIMQDCTWLTKLQISINSMRNDWFWICILKTQLVLIPTTTVLQLHNDAATIQMKEIVIENTLYHNLYLIQLPNGFRCSFHYSNWWKSERFRSNYPHSVVASLLWRLKMGKTWRNSWLYRPCFEPIDEFKGDIARMYFYFATRWKYSCWL
jgi:hypothetical protein